MDDLDKQLAELQLINNTELPPNPGVKKVGPAVPPKPKKQQQQPLVSDNKSLGQSAIVFCIIFYFDTKTFELAAESSLIAKRVK